MDTQRNNPAQSEPRITAVFAEGRDGYPSVRIPSLLVTQAGSILAFAEGRQQRGDHSQNDIVLKRSEDDGRTWSALQRVASEGGDSLNDPSAVVDQRTGRVVLHYTRLAEGFHTQHAPPGYEDPHASRNFVIHSDDDGHTWSTPIETTRAIKRPHVRAAVVSCGVGIQLRRGPFAGRLVHAVYQFCDRPDRESYVCFSDDGGATWTRGEVGSVPGDDRTAEPQVVELSDGTLMMNARTIAKRRRVGFSHDGGVTFGEMESVPVLVEPACQASILRYSDPLDGEPSRILFSNPASETERANGTVRLSYDEGRTWPVARTIYKEGFAYSCLAAMPDGSIGCLFEKDNYAEIAFARFSLDWLESG